MGRRIVCIVIYCCQTLICVANLQVPDVRIFLEAEQDIFHPKAILPVHLRIENVSGHSGNILIPYDQNAGKSLFQLLVYQIDSTGNYLLVYTSPISLDMDTSTYQSTAGFWQLEPNESFILPFFINDTINRRKRFESSLLTHDLTEGKYAFQMIYLPENSSFFRYAFLAQGVTDPIPEDGVDFYPNHFKWDGPFASDFLEIRFLNNAHSSFQPCRNHCSMCKHIFNENWNRLKNKWDKRSRVTPHPNILWVYPGPQSILLSLPSYYGYDAILYTKSGIRYISCNYQLGRILRIRSKMTWLCRAVGFRKTPFKTSKVLWSKLIRITLR